MARRRTLEKWLTVLGAVTCGLLGTIKGSSVGVAFCGTAIAGTLPVGIIGLLLGGLLGNKLGTELDRAGECRACRRNAASR